MNYNNELQLCVYFCISYLLLCNNINRSLASWKEHTFIISQFLGPLQADSLGVSQGWVLTEGLTEDGSVSISQGDSPHSVPWCQPKPLSHNMASYFFKTSKGDSLSMWQMLQFYVTEVIYHHLCHILWVQSKLEVPPTFKENAKYKGIYQGRGSWGSP